MEKNKQIIEKKHLSGKGYYIFGLIDTNDVVSLHQSISRFHLMMYTDENLDLFLVDLGSKAGSFREVNQEYNQNLEEDEELAKESVQDQKQALEKKERRSGELMIEKLHTLPINKVFLAKLGKKEKLKLAHALKTGVVDVEKVNAMASVGSLELLRQTIDGITEEDLKQSVKVTGFAGEILESEKLRPWIPVRMTAGIEKIRIGLSTRNYYIIPDYLKVEKFLEKRERELLVDSKMLALKCRAGLNQTLPESLTQVKVMKTLYVSGIDNSMTKNMIRDVFKPYGEIDYIKIPTDRKGKYKGFCFVTFIKEEQVSNVLKSTGFYINQKRLTVKLAEEDKNQTIYKLEQFEKRWEENQKIPTETLPFEDFHRPKQRAFTNDRFRFRGESPRGSKHKTRKIKKDKKNRKAKKSRKSKRKRKKRTPSSSE